MAARSAACPDRAGVGAGTCASVAVGAGRSQPARAAASTIAVRLILLRMAPPVGMVASADGGAGSDGEAKLGRGGPGLRIGTTRGGPENPRGGPGYSGK